jgi:hypothetical protein
MGAAFLRLRRQGADEAEIRKAPFIQSERLAALIEDEEDEKADGDVVVMQVRRTTISFYMRDLACLFQGEENARRLLRNAFLHNDFVEIRLMRGLLAYYNREQYERIRAAYAQT